MPNADVFISFTLIHNANKSDAINLQQSFGWGVHYTTDLICCLAKLTQCQF